MSKWTKPLALTLVSACFTLAGSPPNSAFAQSPNTAVLLAGATESLPKEEAGTTAKLIHISPANDPKTAPSKPHHVVNHLANFNETTTAPTTVASLPPSEPIAAPKTTPLPTRPKTALPTVIVRPPAEGFFEGDGVLVDVDRTGENSADEFAVKLRVPHSVKIIEVTPIQNGSVAQNYKIRLTQKPDERHITSHITQLLEKTPGELVSNQISDVSPKPMETSPGFQRNPFFNTQAPPPMRRIGNERTAKAQVAELTDSVREREPTVAQTISVKTATKPSASPKQRATQTVSPAASVLTKESAALLSESKTELNFTQYATPTLAEPAPAEVSKPNTVPPIVSSSQANSAEQAIYKAASGQAKSFEMLEGVVFNSADSAMPSQVRVNSKLVGPETMGLNDVCEFQLELHNPSNDPEENLSIQITLPLGLEFPSNDDISRNGTQTQTWNLPRLAAQETQIIQYWVKSTSEGSKTQKLWISSKGNAPRARQIDTIVDLEFETEDAPMLPFESEIE